MKVNKKGLVLSIVALIIVFICIITSVVTKDTETNEFSEDVFCYDKEFKNKEFKSKIPDIEVKEGNIVGISVTTSTGALDFRIDNYLCKVSAEQLLHSVFPKDWNGEEVRVRYSEETNLTQYLFFDIDGGICEVQLNEDKTINYLLYDDRDFSKEEQNYASVVKTYNLVYDYPTKRIKDASIVMDKKNQIFYYYGEEDKDYFAETAEFYRSENALDGMEVLFDKENCLNMNAKKEQEAKESECSDGSCDLNANPTCADLGGCIDENDDSICDRCGMNMSKGE